VTYYTRNASLYYLAKYQWWTASENVKHILRNFDTVNYKTV